MTVANWLAAVARPDAEMRRTLTGLYGPDADLWRPRLALWRAALERYATRFGDHEVVLCRAPARLSFNPHSDHQGSFVLYGCHHRELVVVAGASADGRTHLVNADFSHAQDLAFNLTAEIGRAPVAWRGGWLTYIESPAVKAAVAAAADPKDRRFGRRGSLNYVRAALLRLEHHHPGRLGGYNLAVAGDIPPAAGLSSSSALVVATALAAEALSGLTLDRAALTPLLGQAEWYVGTRGGSGDHGAMLLGHREGLVNLAFEPPLALRAVRHCRWPAGLGLLLANCGVRAEKSSAAKRQFNRGVFAYKFACAELRRHLAKRDPDLAERTRWLADFATLPLELVYDLLLALPAQMSLAKLGRRYAEGFEALLQSFFDTADPDLLPDAVPLRGAALYGLGRADRGRVQDGLLDDGSPTALAEFGHLLNVAHDGDRLFRLSADGAMAPCGPQELDDDSLRAARATQRPLRLEPGCYGASIAELDRIVDLARGVPGVLGAGLMGAGGGGVVQILTNNDEAVTAELRQVLGAGYYGPAGLEPMIECWRPAAEAGQVPAGGGGVTT